MIGRRNSRGPWRWIGFIGGAVAGTVAVVTALPAIKKRARRVTTILKKDHRVVSGLFWSLQQTTNPHIRKSIFSEINTQLNAHALAEEEIFYPAVRHLRMNNAEQQVDDANRDHQQIKDLCHQILLIDPNSFEFMSKVNELKDRVERHVEEEENEMFPVAQMHMSNEELDYLGQRLHERKVQLKERIAA